MERMRIEFNSDGFKEVLSSGGAQSLVQGMADAIAARANANNTRGGEGYVAEVFYGGGFGRWIGVVKATDKESMIAESEDKALSSAL